jgi:DNA-3-methyladenine glycosylase
MDNYLRSIGLDLSNSLSAARSLLGYKLVHREPGGIITSGYIVETEAYHPTEEASHSFRGPTKRNASLFEAAGTIYVYFTYGMHFCVNIVTGNEGQGQAVLIRALEPIDGISLMEKRRNQTKLELLTSGPGKLTQALAIERSIDGTNIQNGPLHLEPGFKPKSIITSKRIGISRAIDLPWRFYIENNKFVSKL